MLEAEGDVGLIHRGEAFDWVAAGGRGCQAIEELAIADCAELAGDLFAAAEVQVDGGRRVFDALGELAHGEGGKAFLVDDLQGGVQYVLALVFLFTLPAFFGSHEVVPILPVDNTL